MTFDPFDDLSYGEHLQQNRFCNFAIAAAVATVASAAYGIASSASAPDASSSGSSGSSGLKTGSTSSIATQTAPTLTDSVAAKVYDPTNQMNSWTDIFKNMGTNSSKIDIPQAATLNDDPNITPGAPQP